ncbi:MAG: hypothetical protein NT010_08490 [Proteobacteria bacterium]|nr:hypothetical protein [Pseudomonadota bacterium]
MKHRSVMIFLAFTSICTMIFFASNSFAALLIDDFSNTATTALSWKQKNFDSNQTVAQINDQVEITIGGSSSGPDFSAGLRSKFELKGDFDIRIKFQLLDWPAANGVRAGIQYGSKDFPGNGQVVRQSVGAGEPPNPKENFVTNFQEVGSMDVTFIPQGATIGGLRLQREGSVMTGYYSISYGTWNLIDSHDYSATGALGEWVGIGLAAWSHTTLIGSEGEIISPVFSGQDVKVAFDNLNITYDTMRDMHHPVPVPPSLLLLAPGLAGLIAARRRFKK